MEDERLATYLDRFQLTHVFDERLRRHLERVEVEPGEYLCQQGDDAKQLYLLVEGKLKITHMSAAGRRLVLSFKHPFDLVGDIEYVRRIPLMNTVEAVTPVQVFRISYAALEQVGTDNPAFLRFLLETITMKFELKSHSMSFNLLYPVEVRLASYLLSMTPEKQTLPVTDLVDAADLIGTSYRHLNRVLLQFSRDGLIDRTKRTIEIIDRAGLMERVGESIYE
ncbi:MULTISPECIES: Crp/Fnr family transcriptional regulator [unclassified Exiguobacterium]|uniref:Crp/Fnr family transcriptional regulator n=1 Tax=unclassified Exiguobacterium TaxID=2644629 RepID=UPI001BE9A87B